MAGPFEAADFDKLVPSDKKLSREWIQSLYERGTPTVYKGADQLKYIGMPVGGLCAGQVYLGGDGRLWHWDIFNQHIGTGSGHYAKPMEAQSPVKLNFSLAIGGNATSRAIPLDQSGFSDVSFSGQYPIGTVEYHDTKVPVSVKLEALSPFIPLNVEDSSLPATILRYTLTNTSSQAVDIKLAASLENPVLVHHPEALAAGENHIVHGDARSSLVCSAGVSRDSAPFTPVKQDLIYEDWNKDSYEGWTVEGAAFGTRPAKKSEIPAYMGDLGGPGQHVANSHASAPGKGVGEKDNQTGKLTSKSFTLTHRFIHFWIGGGSFKGHTCFNLVVEGKVVRTATGEKANKMEQKTWDVGVWTGKQAQLEIVDDQKGSWGNIGVGIVRFSDRPLEDTKPDELGDFGTFALTLLGKKADIATAAQGENPFAPADQHKDMATTPHGRPVGALGRSLHLEAGQSQQVDFVVSWHFPNLTLKGLGKVGRYYATKFASAEAVVEYVATHVDRLTSQTRLFRDTWYDSTLPFWFLDRTLLNACILATSTSYRFADGRFYGWEGVGCCPGTCTHVWQYEQAMGRLFPELDVLLRERADFNPEVGFKPDGMIDHRGEYHSGHAIDGQAGTILRAYRDHQMQPDHEFLKRNWASIKKAMHWMIDQDANADGILEGGQHNTLDAQWFGPVAWLSGLYQAALRATHEMAKEMADEDFARQCLQIADVGRQNLAKLLFNGEYFINKPDPKHPEAINSGSGCEIDQVMGQSWAYQVGLDRVFPENETKSALQALWRYNFSPDVGPYRAINKPGRWYAMAGEAGLLMCTFPKSDWSFEKARGNKGNPGFAGYFNECMNGFEYQVAGHMIWEGMVEQGLAIGRAVHDRYHGSRRNPWNEVECGDHYARSMASYGLFTAACGFAYHGPKGHIAFVPRLTPDDFRCAFTSAEGWGTFSQRRDANGTHAKIAVRWGRLNLTTLGLVPRDLVAKTVTVELAGKSIAAVAEIRDQRLHVVVKQPLTIEAGQEISVTVQA